MNQSPNGQDAAEEGGDQAQGTSWRGTAEEFEFLRDSFRSSYKEGASQAPTREEVAAALRTLAAVVSQMVAGAGNTLKDPAVKQQVQKTTRSVMLSLAGLFTDWVAVVRSRVDNRGRGQRDSAEGQESGETDVASDDAGSPADDQGSPAEEEAAATPNQ